MDLFLQITFGLPTVLFTVPLGCALVYWVLVLSGVLDLDALDHLFHGADAALDGVADGVAEGAAKAAAEGAAHVVGGEALDFLAFLKLRSVPVTISASFIALYGYGLSYLGARFLAPLVPGPGWLGGAAVFVLATMLATLAASITVRPLGGLLAVDHAKRRQDLLGHTATISTGRVDGRFGQATLEDGGAGLILQVRYDAKPGAPELRRGDPVLIVHFDEARDAFVVEPMQRPGASTPASAQGQGQRARPTQTVK